MLRHRLAAPWLAAHRLTRPFRGAPGAGFRVLLFHDVPDAQWPAFERLVDHVAARHGTLCPDEAAAVVRGEAAPPRTRGGRLPCLFSFDDGFVSNRRIADEVLAPRGIRGLFFVCPGLVELTGDNQREAVARNVHRGRIRARDLGAGVRLMTWDEIAGLAAAGHAIGAHGMTHRRLTDLAGGELEREVAEAGERLAARLGEPVQWYAYAFGDIDSISAAAIGVIARHYPLCRSGVRGANGGDVGPWAVRADMVPLDAPFAYQQLVIEGGLDARYGAARRRLDALAAALS